VGDGLVPSSRAAKVAQWMGVKMEYLLRTHKSTMGKTGVNGSKGRINSDRLSEGIRGDDYGVIVVWSPIISIDEKSQGGEGQGGLLPFCLRRALGQGTRITSYPRAIPFFPVRFSSSKRLTCPI